MADDPDLALPAGLSEAAEPARVANSGDGSDRSDRGGEIVIVTDDDDRRTKANLIMAALALQRRRRWPSSSAIAAASFCAPLPTLSEARRLHLQPMVAANDAPLGTAFRSTSSTA